MIECPALATARRITVGDSQNSLAVGRRGPVLMQNFHFLETPAYPNGERDPERMGRVERSAAYGAKTVTLDVTEYAEVKARSPIGKKTEGFLRFAIGPLLYVALAVAAAMTPSHLPAPDRPVSLAGPLSGHSLLHFPR
jgi:catalase